MAKFHINPETGNPGQCSASKHQCPFGDANDHYDSPEAARAAYETMMASVTDMFPAKSRTPEEVFAIIKGDDREAKLALASSRAFEDFEPSALSYLAQDADPAVRAAVAETHRYYDELADSPELKELDAWIDNRFYSAAHPANQQLFRQSMQRAVAGVGLELQYSPLDSFTGPKATAFFAIERAARATDWTDTGAALDVARVVQDERDRLAEEARSLDLTTRSGRKQAAAYQAMVRGLDRTLASVQFSMLDEDYTEDPEGAQARWLATAASLAYQPPPRVPCDDRHAARIAQQGYCPKCGGAN